MSGWSPGYILANVNVERSIENEYFALLSCNDRRVMDIRTAYKEFDGLITNFSDEFGVQVAPSVMMIRDHLQAGIVTIDAVAGFRDAIALSYVCKSRTLRLIYRHARPFQFSSSFDFYPWITATDYSSIIGNTPALRGWHVTETFHGQTTAGLPNATLTSLDCDDTLLKALLGEWERRFVTHVTSWRGVALFRSMNMAYAASQVPSGPDMTHHALGRSVGLWISAIEILAHPGQNGSVGFKNIYDLLNDVDWHACELREVVHEAYAGRGKTALNNLPCWIYGELFRARNDFLHGEPIAQDRLIVHSSGQTLYNFAAPLYRMCLASFLGLKQYGPLPSEDNDQALRSFYEWRHDVNSDQADTERALGRVLKPVS